MGDRTSVTLTVLASQAEKAEELFDGENPDNDCDLDGDIAPDELYQFEFSDVDYGTLGFLPKLLAAGIAYDSNWGAGGNYTGGIEHCRFTDTGEVIVRLVYDTEVNPDLGSLLENIEDHQALKELILEHRSRVTPLPLDHQQILNGKLYQTKQLINPTKPSN